MTTTENRHGETAVSICQENKVDISGYSQATIRYSALIAGSLAKRTGCALAKGAGNATDAAWRAACYSAATMEYAGLKSASLVARGAGATGECAAKLLSPVGRAVASPFCAVSRRAGQLLARRRRQDPAVAERLANLEQRVAALERAEPGPRQEPEKKPESRQVDESRKAVLRAVMLENKILRAAQ